MNNNFETAKMLVNFFNMQASANIRMSETNKNFDLVVSAIEKSNDNIASIKEHITAYVKSHPEVKTGDNDCKRRRFIDCFRCYAGSTGNKSEDIPSTATEIEKKMEKVESREESVTKSLGILEHALMVAIREQSIPEIEKDIKGECTKLLQDFIKNEYGTIERKVITIIDGEKKELPKGTFLHEKFDTVLKFVSNDEPVFLTGPAGSGKNHLCKQVADSLGLKFYFTNAVTQEYKLTGFTDANGKYQPTQFYQAFKNGGLFMLDEMDASIPEVLVILNAAIANRYFDFPAPIGYVEAHKDFRIIAAGNTTGHGADYEYVGRNQLDAASLDRFAVVPIDYSKEIEDGMAMDVELADFCREFRKASQKVGVQMIVSYRAIGRLAKMTQLLDLPEALSTCLLKGLGKDDINVICNELKDSKYKQAMRNLIA